MQKPNLIFHGSKKQQQQQQLVNNNTLGLLPMGSRTRPLCISSSPDRRCSRWLKCWRVAPPPLEHLVSLKTEILLHTINNCISKLERDSTNELKRNVYSGSSFTRNMHYNSIFIQIWRVQMSARVCHITEWFHVQITPREFILHVLCHNTKRFHSLGGAWFLIALWCIPCNGFEACLPSLMWSCRSLASPKTVKNRNIEECFKCAGHWLY